MRRWVIQAQANGGSRPGVTTEESAEIERLKAETSGCVSRASRSRHAPTGDPAKAAQKNKLMNDAVKLHWIALSLVPRPDQLILCVSGPAAIRHLQGAAWQGVAIADLGVTLEVVQLPERIITSIAAAQKWQYR